MSDPIGPLLSVRGDARQTVAPDYVALPSIITASRASKAESLQTVAAALDRLVVDLGAREGVPLSVGTERRPLTWSAHSATTRLEREPDELTGRYELTGQVTAPVELLITVRALHSLDALGALLAVHESLNVQDAVWGVDPDNPAWPDVRAAAIRAAIREGRDYAAALGGSLHHVEHIADVGLLHAGGSAPYDGSYVAQSAGGYVGDHDAPSLDPVPPVLTATIEARFMAVDVSLA